jgi:hypothetical protein
MKNDERRPSSGIRTGTVHALRFIRLGLPGDSPWRVDPPVEGDSRSLKIRYERKRLIAFVDVTMISFSESQKAEP